MIASLLAVLGSWAVLAPAVVVASPRDDLAATEAVLRLTDNVLSGIVDKAAIGADLELLLAHHDAPRPHHAASPDRILPEWLSESPSDFVLTRLLRAESDATASRFAGIVLALLPDPIGAEEQDAILPRLFGRRSWRPARRFVAICVHLLRRLTPSERICTAFVESLDFAEAAQVIDRIDRPLTNALDPGSDDPARQLCGRIHFLLMRRDDTRPLYFMLDDPLLSKKILLSFGSWTPGMIRIFGSVDPIGSVSDHDIPVSPCTAAMVLRCLMPTCDAAGDSVGHDVPPVLARLLANASATIGMHECVVLALLESGYFPETPCNWAVLVRALDAATQPVQRMASFLFELIAARSYLDRPVALDESLRAVLLSLWPMLDRWTQQLAHADYPVLKQLNWPIQAAMTHADLERIRKRGVCSHCQQELFGIGAKSVYKSDDCEDLLNKIRDTATPYCSVSMRAGERYRIFLVTKSASEQSLLCTVCAIHQRSDSRPTDGPSS